MMVVALLVMMATITKMTVMAVVVVLVLVLFLVLVVFVVVFLVFVFVFVSAVVAGSVVLVVAIANGRLVVEPASAPGPDRARAPFREWHDLSGATWLSFSVVQDRASGLFRI